MKEKRGKRIKPKTNNGKANGKKKLVIYGCGMKKTIIGNKGIQIEETQSVYQPFGKFLINVKQLSENKLRVLYAKTYLNVQKTFQMSSKIYCS